MCFLNLVVDQILEMARVFVGLNNEKLFVEQVYLVNGNKKNKTTFKFCGQKYNFLLGNAKN